jgi:hypothetical protein
VVGPVKETTTTAGRGPMTKNRDDSTKQNEKNKTKH